MVDSPHSQLQTLPAEVINCLKNARYLHLATSNGLWPHVSLMNYTYLSHSPYALPPPPPPGGPSTFSEEEEKLQSLTSSSSGPLIVMTAQTGTRKMLNLQANPRVSLLVHDWVSHRSRSNYFDPTVGITNPTAEEEERQSPRTSSPKQRSTHAHESSLATLLANLNSAELSNISATLNGYAYIIPQGTEEEEFYKKKHLENNRSQNDDDNGGDCYLVGEDVRVVVVRIAGARVSDWRGEVRNFEYITGGTSNLSNVGLVNGV